MKRVGTLGIKKIVLYLPVPGAWAGRTNFLRITNNNTSFYKQFKQLYLLLRFSFA
jgi:hypothetical protein